MTTEPRVVSKKSKSQTVTVDATCKVPNCSTHRGTYTMSGRCINCRTECIEITYSRRERARTVACPICGYEGVSPQMLVSADV